jgi:hypothetical protein
MEGDDGMTMSSNDDNMHSMNMAMTFFTGKGFCLLFDGVHIASDTDLFLVPYNTPRASTCESAKFR